MNKYLISVLLLSTSAFPLTFTVQNAGLEYNHGKGAIAVERVQLKSEYVAVDARDYQFDLESNEAGLSFKNYNHDLRFFKLEDILTNIKDFHQLNFTGAQLQLSESLTLEAPHFHINYDHNQVSIEAISAHCPKVDLNPLPGCLQQASIQARALILPDIFSLALAQALAQSEPTTPELVKSAAAYRPKITNIKLAVTEKKFSGTAVMKLLFNIQFQLSGHVDVDLNKRVISLTKVSVRKGIIPVTKAVLFALAKMKIKGLKIVGNNLYIEI